MEIKNKKILVLSSHTDDAEMGAGGSIIKLKENNNILWVAFSIFLPNMEAIKEVSIKEFNNAMNFLRIKTKIFDYQIREFHKNRQDILQNLIDIRKTFSPDLIISPSLNDFHQDHKTIANEAIRAFKTSASIICYELPWNHIDFRTQFFIELKKEHIDKKIKLVNFYKSQKVVRRHYFSKNFIRGLAFVRGSQIDCEYAESFEIIRWRNV